MRECASNCVSVNEGDESSTRLLGDVITEGPDGPSLGTFFGSNYLYALYLYFISIYVRMWVRY